MSFFKIKNPNSHISGFLLSKNFVALLFIVLLPLFIKYSWSSILDIYNILGNDDNRNVGSHYISEMINLPSFAYHHTQFFFSTIYSHILILFNNYINYEYWTYIGYLGITFFFFVPFFVNAKAAILLYSMFLAFFSISLLSSLPAAFFPHERWSTNLPLTPFRANGGYFTFVFSQFLGMYFIFTVIFKALNTSYIHIKNDKFASFFIFLASLLVYFASFYNIYQLWLKYGDLIPMYPGGLKALGW